MWRWKQQVQQTSLCPDLEQQPSYLNNCFTAKLNKFDFVWISLILATKTKNLTITKKTFSVVSFHPVVSTPRFFIPALEVFPRNVFLSVPRDTSKMIRKDKANPINDPRKAIHPTWPSCDRFGWNTKKQKQNLYREPKKTGIRIYTSYHFFGKDLSWQSIDINWSERIGWSQISQSYFSLIQLANRDGQLTALLPFSRIKLNEMTRKGIQTESRGGSDSKEVTLTSYHHYVTMHRNNKCLHSSIFCSFSIQSSLTFRWNIDQNLVWLHIHSIHFVCQPRTHNFANGLSLCKVM